MERATRTWHWLPAILVIAFVGSLAASRLTGTASTEVGQPAAPAYDVLLQGGKVVDGTGAPWYIADVAIADGKIAAMGKLDPASAQRVIDASGLVVAPGFIDMMGQTATPMLDRPGTALNLLTQGITTINAGEGDSAAPLAKEEGDARGWTTMTEYFQILELQGLPVNVAQTVGHSQMREIVLGNTDRQPTPEELQRMQALVAEAMEAGAIGVSTALIYPPAVYAKTEEIGALAEVAGRYGGRYYTHMRNEGDQLLEAIDEALAIGRQGHCPVHIFHLKAAGQQNWPKMQQAIDKIKAARAAGEQVTADIYPYINNGLGIAALVHPRHFTQGNEAFVTKLDDAKFRAEVRQEMETTDGWENWYRHVGYDWNKVIIGGTPHPNYQDLAGKSVAEMAQARGEDPWDTFFNLLRTGAFALPQSMTEANKILAMQQDFVSFCTDVGPAGEAASVSHPRAFGAFPRLLSKYVREQTAISLERAVAQASAAAANNILAYDRGRIAIGLAADVIVFDYEHLADNATFAKPAKVSTGMKYVFVNGVLVLEDGNLLAPRPGRVLRGPGYNAERAPAAVFVGEMDPAMEPFDTAIRAFMQEHCIPGAAVAVTDGGRLVFARGYGYADLATGEKATPNSLFRIASISKPFTAVKIMQLVEAGKLSLDDKAFDVLGLSEAIRDKPQRDQRLNDITIRHLLQHRGGWDRDQSFDAMFRSVQFARAMEVPPPASPADVIQAMLDQKLDFTPGERYAYSNFGYCLLGRVIEKLTGETYERATRATVLAPLGMHDMRIGATRLVGQGPGEVRYYGAARGPSVFEPDLGRLLPRQYGGWYLEAMDSHGGWLSSAADLARFACALQDPRHPLLSAESLAEMAKRPEGLAGFDENGKPKPTFYSLGWMNRMVGADQQNSWHTGSLDGTATVLICRDDGKNFVAVFNTRSGPAGQHLGQAIDPVLNEAASQVKAWPRIDLFPEVNPYFKQNCNQ